MKKQRKGRLLHLPMRAYSSLGGWAGRMVEGKPKQETEFLPGALEVVETPPSPTGRIIIRTIILFVVISVLWATFSHIDVVATASGKIIPSGKAKIIQPAEIGVVQQILVKEGQRVKKGDLLISLDPTINEADVTELENRLVRAFCDNILYAELCSWKVGTPVRKKLVFAAGTDSNLRLLYQHRFEYEAMAINDKLSGIAGEIDKSRIHQQNIKHQIKKKSAVLNIITKRTEAMRRLYEQDSASEHDWLFQEQKRVAAEQDYESVKQEEQECLAAIEKLERDKKQVISEFRRDTLHKKSDAQNMIEMLQQRLAKAEQRNRLQQLTAPVDGEVQQLSVHTIGGVVKEAQPLMVIVPERSKLEVEASILNRDIGFVKEGQHAEIKLEAFPYTEYGSIPGEVISVSSDAVQDREGRLTFLCRVKLNQDFIPVNGQKVKLIPGMRATAEVAIRKRRLITYFLSPLMKYKTESLRER